MLSAAKYQRCHRKHGDIINVKCGKIWEHTRIDKPNQEWLCFNRISMVISNHRDYPGLSGAYQFTPIKRLPILNLKCPKVSRGLVDRFNSWLLISGNVFETIDNRKMLTHWGRYKMAAIFQTTFSNAFSWMEMYEFRLLFHWSLFPRFELTISQHWSR